MILWNHEILQISAIFEKIRTEKKTFWIKGSRTYTEFCHSYTLTYTRKLSLDGLYNGLSTLASSCLLSPYKANHQPHSHLTEINKKYIKQCFSKNKIHFCLKPCPTISFQKVRVFGTEFMNDWKRSGYVMFWRIWTNANLCIRLKLP